jgi:glycosyltransferase involved in cell wall biosynthesis
MNRPAITFVVRSLDAGGAERQLVQLAVGLHEAGWRVNVITFYANGVLEKELHARGIPILCLHKQGRWDLLSLWRLAKDLRESPPDVVHGYLPVPNILSVLLRPARHTRVVWGVRASNMDLDRYNWLWKVEFTAARMLSRFADLIIANSKAGYDHHIACGYPRQRVLVIPNGIDLDQFAPNGSARRRVRDEWRVGTEEKLIGLIARLDPMKDHPNFLLAAAVVMRARPNARFVCVGAGEAAYQESLEQLAAQHGLTERIIWAGLRTDMAAVYAALDLAVSSSSFGEGFPNVVAEAMASGVPCVVTDVGDSAAIVGDRRWVCPPSDSAALADVIVAAMDALPLDGVALRERVCRHFSSQALVERTAIQLLKLLDTARETVKTQPQRAEAVTPSRDL